MKKGVIVSIILIAIVLCGIFSPARYAHADSTPVILLSGKKDGDEIVVDVTMRNNQGISAMNLSLEYDTDKIELVGYTQGQALATLDLITTNTETDKGYAIYPFKFNWSGEANDSTNGKFLTLRFAALKNATGKAHVTFTYKQGADVNYISDEELKTQNVLIDVLQFDLSEDGKPVNFVNNEALLNEIGEKTEDKTTALAVGLALGGTP